ncbi:hypothetical protein MVES1_001727 [Malassezia vespertilionis]|uniref:uncharacterized protein n=1 Tax=Malassezia vespertilionis TaxID=2020962 RepID=UPI0024B14FCA|nr:uncharacterized protein MVES1_001727 [Malassezia vespertilionis]WFD06382.1 hypothetical protein MVES1_001727 [Malassezia vespertilionis]
MTLYRRYVDLLYFLYFAMHLFASVCIDNYLVKSADPLLPNAWLPQYTWFRISLLSEFVFQLPVFAIGLYAMWNSTSIRILTADEKRWYPLLATYGAIGCFTTMQCIATVLLGEERAALTPANLRFLLQNYVPFMLIPGVIAVDFTLRSMRLLSVHKKQEKGQ